MFFLESAGLYRWCRIQSPIFKTQKKFLYKNKFATTKLKQQNCSNNNAGGFYSLLHLNQLNAISESQQEMKCFQLKLLSITGIIKNASHTYLLFQKCFFFGRLILAGSWRKRLDNLKILISMHCSYIMFIMYCVKIYFVGKFLAI